MEATPSQTSQRASFADIINAGDKPVLVDFWAEWCQPCHMVAPIVKRLGTELQGKMTVIKVNIDENPSVGPAYGIQGIPTLILFYKGNILWRTTGVQPFEALHDQIRRVLPDM